MTTVAANLPSQDAPPAGARMHWSLGAAALVSFAAFFLTSGRAIGIPVLSLMLIASYLTRWRLAHDLILRAIIRIVPMTAIVMVVGIPDEEFFGWYLKRSYTDLLGYLVATEVVIHAWTAHTKRRFNSEAIASGTALFLTSLLMIAASNTYDRVYIQLLTPLYVTFLIIALRAMQPRRPAAEKRQWRRGLTGLRIVAWALALVIGFTAVASVTYFDAALTRWASNMLRQNRRPKSEIGLSTMPRLQGVFNPAESTDRVLVIEGSQAERYLRAYACDTYTERQWKPTLQERGFAPVVPLAQPREQSSDDLQVTRLFDTFDLVLMPLETSALDPHAEVTQDIFGSFKQVGLTTLGKYDMVVPTRPGHQGIACLTPTDEQRASQLAIPTEVDPRVIELAKTVAGEGVAMEKLLRIRNHLRSTHTYSLSYQPTGEPLSDFILNKGAAHCQYFASALVVMARGAGVPARYVGGYLAHEPYGDNQLVVRQRDAHAWAECWVDGTGWITFDATPSGGRPSEMFDETSAWQRWWEGVQDKWTAFREWLGGLHRSSVILVIAIPTGALLIYRIAMWWIARRRGRGLPNTAYLSPGAELASAAKRFEALLASAGATPLSHRTWREHVAALRDGPSPVVTDPSLYLSFIDAYDRARFREPQPATIARVNALLTTLEQTPRAATRSAPGD